MAGLCWISVLLAVSLSIGDCEPLDIGYVTRIAQLIEANYHQGTQFSVAINIPEDLIELSEAFDNIDHDLMNSALANGEVYIGRNAVVAVPQNRISEDDVHYTDHSEPQVLDEVWNLEHDGNILVLYSWLSPCGQKCTDSYNRENILDKITENVYHTTYAFVFNTVFTETQDHVVIDEQEIKDTFYYLQEVIVDDNIFRCYTIENVFRCVKCFQIVGDSNEATLVNECFQD